MYALNVFKFAQIIVLIKLIYYQLRLYLLIRITNISTLLSFTSPVTAHARISVFMILFYSTKYV